MIPLLNKQNSREVDRHAIQEFGVPELILMEHAAMAVAKAVKGRFSTTPGFGVILAGRGNNGADAVACARLLKELGHESRVFLSGDPSQLTQSGLTQWRAAERLGIPCRPFSQWTDIADQVLQADWVVDGLLGVGLDRAVQNPLAQVIEAINQLQKYVFAVDVPSGLNADTGQAMGVAMVAQTTLTFGFLKQGLVTGNAADFVGQLKLAPIQIPREVPYRSKIALVEAQDIAVWLPKRTPCSHKGTHGHVYLWAGIPETQGACALAARGALRAGAGLATVVGQENLDSLRSRLVPEIMCRPFSEDLLQSGVWVIGPGLGMTEPGWKALKKLMQSPVSLVIDGDGLNLMAKHRDEVELLLRGRDSPTVLTPHPKEAARLLDQSVEQVEQDRYRAVAQLEEYFPNTTSILKGRGSLVASAGETWVVNAGNSTQAKGGSGDVLSGIVAALLAQGVEPAKSCAIALYLHGRAAEWLSQRQGTERFALAGEVADVLDQVFHELEYL